MLDRKEQQLLNPDLQYWSFPTGSSRESLFGVSAFDAYKRLSGYFSRGGGARKLWARVKDLIAS